MGGDVESPLPRRGTLLVNPSDLSVEGAHRLSRLHRRAEAYLQAGQREEAAAALRQALDLFPDDVATLLGLAQLELSAERHTAGRALVARAAVGRLSTPGLALRLLAAFNAIGESSAVVDLARQIPPAAWDSAASVAEVAHALTLIGAHDLALEFARAAVQRDPNFPPALYDLATLELYFGDLEACARHAEACLRISPLDPGSLYLLSRLALPEPGPRIERLHRALKSNSDPECEAYLAYALHNELHAAGDFAAAWDALERGCRARRSLLGYSREASDALFAALREWDEVTPASTAGRAGDGPDSVPVFIIGLHRSGTTLVERILGGHPELAAGGETHDIRTQLRRASGLHYGGDLDLRVVQARAGLDYQAIGDGYLRGMAWRRQGRRLFTDKLPSNYLNLGFIARALPTARFIHLVRDPLQVGLSSLRTLFGTACAYSYDQLDFVHHYRNYRGLMAHWRGLLGERLLDVSYEDLVRRPEQESARIAAFCGLEYRPSMLAIGERKEAVSTASSELMRDGIRSDRGEIWRAYETQLEPMRSALQGAG